MHIEGPWLSTTSTKQRAEKLTKAKKEELERNWRERNARLKEMHLPKETFEQFLDWVYGRGKKEKRDTTIRTKVSKTAPAKNITSKGTDTNTPVVNVNEVSKAVPKSLGSWVTGPVSSKPSPTYTGTKILGIATMHKSNLVPVFSDEEAVDISKMRRG
jgi:hypothetical protein